MSSNDMFPGSNRTRLRIADVPSSDVYICRDQISPVVMDDHNLLRAFVRKRTSPDEVVYQFTPGQRLLLTRHDTKTKEQFIGMFEIVQATYDLSPATMKLKRDVIDLILKPLPPIK